jgi:hypothetical protein
VCGNVAGIRIPGPVDPTEVPILVVIGCTVYQQLYGRSRAPLVFRRAELTADCVLCRLSRRQSHRNSGVVPAGYLVVDVGMR